MEGYRAREVFFDLVSVCAAVHEHVLQPIVGQEMEGIVEERSVGEWQ